MEGSSAASAFQAASGKRGYRMASQPPAESPDPVDSPDHFQTGFASSGIVPATARPQRADIPHRQVKFPFTSDGGRAIWKTLVMVRRRPDGWM